MTSTRVVAIVAAVVLAFASVPARAGDPAVEKLAADWAAAFERGDVKALAGLYTDNAIRITPESGRVVGRDAIAKEFATNFAGPWKGAKIKIVVGAVQPVGADVAVGEGTYEVMLSGPDGKPASVKGSYVNTMVKKSGAWVLASNAAVLPAPAPPSK